MPTKTQTPPEKEVDWSSYAQTYDLLLSYNPFYQELYKEVIGVAQAWDLPEGSMIADIGAGTGNYSCTLAKLFPQVKVVHVDQDPGMCQVALQKVQERGLNNMEIRNEGVDEVFIPPSSIDACTCIHALYTFPNPQQVLQNIYGWLTPGGLGIFVDPGRPVRVLDWQIAIARRMIQAHGLRKTLQVMREGKEVSKQNRRAARMQAEGKFWTHSHAEFCEAVIDAGFEILEAHSTFRGISDFVVARKA